MLDPKHDVIIIGGGIAGLYAAMKLVQKRPNAKILIVERSSRLGGRIGNSKFRGTSVVCGAGVGRLEKDKLLLSLLQKLNLKPQLLPPVLHHFSKAVKSVDIMETINKLQQIENEVDAGNRKTFKSFASAHLGRKAYREFVQATGYTDFEKQDAHDVLYNYGMDDNADGWTPVRIIWDDLVDALTTWLKRHRNVKIKKRVNITRWGQTPDGGEQIIVHGQKKGSGTGTVDIAYRTSNLVVATTIESITKLFPKKSIYTHIHCQPFIRLYAQVAPSSRKIMADSVSSITIVPSPLQEIIPFNHDQGIYMIGYADNKSANTLHKYENDKHSIAMFAEKALRLPTGSINISHIQSHFWKCGTHFFDVLPIQYQMREEFVREAQRPHPNVFVVGEVVALNQGWVEGALQSVDNVVEEINI